MIEVLLIIALTGCVLDSVTTYRCLRNKPDAYESNIIFNKIFKWLGNEVGSIVGFAISVYVVSRVFHSERYTDDQILWGLLFVSTLKIAAALANHTGKQNWVTKFLIYCVPVYWNWKAIGKFFKSKINRK